MKKFAILCISILILNFLMIDYAECVSSDNFKVSTNISRNEWVSIGISLGVVLGGGLIYWCLEEPDRAPDPFSYIPAETRREDWYILDRAHVIRNENFFSKDYVILKECWKEVLMLLQIGDKTPRNLLSPDQKYFLYICQNSSKYQGRNEELSLFLKDSFDYRPEEHLRFFHLLDTKKRLILSNLKPPFDFEASLFWLKTDRLILSEPEKALALLNNDIFVAPEVQNVAEGLTLDEAHQALLVFDSSV